MRVKRSERRKGRETKRERAKAKKGTEGGENAWLDERRSYFGGQSQPKVRDKEYL